jgi:hypothetical protein
LDKRKLDELLVDTSSTALVSIDEESRMMTSSNLSRICEIDEKLKSYVSADMWEERSLVGTGSLYSMTPTETSRSTVSGRRSNRTKRKEALPGTEALREIREIREINESLSAVNASLAILNSKEIICTEEDLHGLELEAMLALENGQLSLPDVEHRPTTLLHEAQEILQKLCIPIVDDSAEV